MVDANGVRTGWAYDGLGRVTAISGDGQPTEDILYLPRHAGGNVVGTVVQSSSMTGAGLQTSFDSLVRAVEQARKGFDGTWNVQAIHRDVLGRVVSSSRPGIREACKQATRYAFDNLDRLTSETEPNGEITSYGQSFFETTATDPMGHVQQIVRDLDDEVVESVEGIDGREIVTHFNYGPFGQLESTVAPGNHTVAIGYDPRGRRISLQDPDAGLIGFRYNGFGEVRRKTTGSAVAFYRRDRLGRVTQVDDPDGTTTFEWDTATHGRGLLAHTRSPDGTEQDVSYNSQGQAEAQLWTVGGGAVSRSTSG
jgi:YD repeat-containing protein